jgi:hypothetical protein
MGLGRGRTGLDWPFGPVVPVLLLIEMWFPRVLLLSWLVLVVVMMQSR